MSRHILFTHTAQAALALVCQGKVEQFGILCQTDMPQRIQCTGVQVGGAVLFGGAVGAQQTARYRIQVKITAVIPGAYIAGQHPRHVSRLGHGAHFIDGFQLAQRAFLLSGHVQGVQQQAQAVRRFRRLRRQRDGQLRKIGCQGGAFHGFA